MVLGNLCERFLYVQEIFFVFLLLFIYKLFTWSVRIVGQICYPLIQPRKADIQQTRFVSQGRWFLRVEDLPVKTSEIQK